MKKGFHTSAFAEHDLGTACALLKQMEYGVVALRLSLARLDPFAEPSQFLAQIELLRTVLDSVGGRGLGLVLDADAPYLLDPWRRDIGSLLDSGDTGRRRIEIIQEAIKLASELGANLVTFSTGACPDEMDIQLAMDLLADRILQISEMAEAVGVTLAIRPRVGCFVDSISRFERLTQWIGGSPLVRLAADVSTMVAVGEMPVVDGLQRIAEMVACVYFSDIRLGEESIESTEGAWIGSGHISAVRIIRGLRELRFFGPVILEPSELGRWTPENARKLGEIVFDRVIFTK